MIIKIYWCAPPTHWTLVEGANGKFAQRLMPDLAPYEVRQRSNGMNGAYFAVISQRQRVPLLLAETDNGMLTEDERGVLTGLAMVRYGSE